MGCSRRVPVSMTEGSGYKGLPQTTLIPYFREKQRDLPPVEGQFVKKVIIKPCLVSQALFSPQNYVLFATITTPSPVSGLSPGTLPIALPSAATLGTPRRSAAGRKTSPLLIH